MDKSGIKVQGHRGTFSEVNTVTMFDRKCYLMESDIYGEDAPLIAVYEDNTLCADSLYDGYNDLIALIEDAPQDYKDGKYLN